MVRQPYIPATTHLAEITPKVVFLSVILAVVLAASNTYLALKAGILTSASIPAAIISMGILRFFRKSNILENNLVQTCASTGEAVAGGIVYTIPALVIIHYWQHFPYWQCFLISLLGGIFGVLVSVPLRPALLNNAQLRFPEGQAIAEVLMATSEATAGLRELILGGFCGAVINFCQEGLKVLAGSAQYWLQSNGVFFGFGTGFSTTLIGAGYLIGFDLGWSLFIGAIIGWLVCVPVLSFFYPHLAVGKTTTDAVMALWGAKIRYIGIGAMLIAGLWTLLSLLASLAQNFRLSWQKQHHSQVRRTDRDIPMRKVLLMMIGLLIASGFLFLSIFPSFHFQGSYELFFIAFCLIYFLILGFIICAICGYFSGMVGVSASPGSAAILAGMLLIAILIRTLLIGHESQGSVAMSHLHGAAVTIIIGAMITAAAAITNDNMQDLKVGQIVGATPWKQQVMLLFGVLVGSLVVPLVMELLFNVYGIAGVMPHAGMDLQATLPAPPAAMMAALTQSVFKSKMPWGMMAVGGLIGIAVIMLSLMLKSRGKKLSVIGVATGIYLPLSSSTPLFIGSVVALLVQRQLAHRTDASKAAKRQRGLLMACGLVAGSALMNVILAIPFALTGSPNYLRLLPTGYSGYAEALSVIITICLCIRLFLTVMTPRPEVKP